MKESEQKAAAKKFAETWKGRGYEKGETHSFWIELLHDVYGVENPTHFIFFEEQVDLSHKSFIDATIPETHVMIEQKSIGKDLSKPIKQSDGTTLTPYQQAKRYAAELPYSKRPRWIVASNFAEFRVYDMENPQAEPEIILLENLEKEYYRLQFLVNVKSRDAKKEMEISLAAGEIVGKLYDALLSQYKDPTNPESLKSLNKLCVRLVFCLYAEDAGIFGRRNMFHDFLKSFQPQNVRLALIELFKILATPENERDPYINDNLKEFPYVNGGLFEDEKLEIPNFTNEILNLLLQHASEDFDWSGISPTIFGAVFESTLNPETRRAGGMHYTSIENIHKVIDPLFLDELKKELETVKETKQPKTRKQKLKYFQRKLASLTFLDPASGSGNFLTETYISLRRLENEALKEQLGVEMVLGDIDNPIQVSIGQFYGIEINDFAVTVTKTALWIAEAQMMQETEDIVHMSLDFLPLKSYANIVEGNALAIDWETVVPKVDFLMSNPPFVGARMMAQGSRQKTEVEAVFGKIKDVQDLDYVTCWFKKAAEYMRGTKAEAGFVATNSICQGAQVPILWRILLNEYHVHINFAYQTFRWNSESVDKAAVHCVIVGFSPAERREKLLYASSLSEGATGSRLVENINPYLVPAGNIFVEAKKDAPPGIPKMNFGNQPRDGGHFILTEEGRAALLQKEPSLESWIRPYIGAEEFINGKQRWCFWLRHAEPEDIKKSRTLHDIVEAVRAFRLASKAKTTQNYAKVPQLFAQITQPDGADYLLIPRVSSERRRYIPIGFMASEQISSDAVQIIPNATLYHFGVLTSNVHMAWMRTTAGRLKSDYRYSKELVYNTFPWPTPTDAQKARIKQTAKAILDARAKFPRSSMAALYDETTMPPDLRKAHQANDRAVRDAYGFPKGISEAECVARLMEMYQALAGK